MTEQEYFEQIEKIRKHIAGNHLPWAKALLEEMYAYKPVRLLWFVAKAEYVLKAEQDLEAALKILEGKYFPGADYPGMKECMKFRIKAFKQLGRERDAIRENYRYQKACGRPCAQLDQALAEALEDFCGAAENSDALAALGRAFYHTSDMAAYFIVYQELIRRGCPEKTAADAWVRQITNYGYLEEKLCSKEKNTFILVIDECLGRTLEALGFILHSFGHEVFLLDLPLVFETEGQVDLADTLEISWDQLERYPDMSVIHPVLLTQDGVPYGDNREYIIDYICTHESSRDHAILLCSGNLLENLYTRDKMHGRIGRISPYETDLQETMVQFGWVGSYLSYISDIYGYDVGPSIDREPEVDFSIVIPARNSAATLRYTLQTCLEQRYTGSYEILVSDNSVDSETSIYELCQELDDPKIRYVKTPRPLSLIKSFEFAYLQTRGEFVLSMGSDDGLLPWGLETLKLLLDRFPAEEIIEWERGFYAWPGFNGGQENQFVIPRKYKKENIPVHFIQTREILDWVKQDPQMIYCMPLLYINSGFRRRYLKTLLERTGKLWDGINQDIQTGIINCCIYERILQMLYPITIAGMNSGSVGYLDGRAGLKESKAEAQMYRRVFSIDNAGRFVELERERILCAGGLDTSTLYFALSRAVEEGLMTNTAADAVMNWKKAVSFAFRNISILKDTFDASLHREQFIAKQAGSDLKSWFEESIYKDAVLPRHVDETALMRQREEKTYQEEISLGNREVLDASHFDVHNITEAVKLFERRTGL